MFFLYSLNLSLSRILTTKSKGRVNTLIIDKYQAFEIQFKEEHRYIDRLLINRLCSLFVDVQLNINIDRLLFLN